MFKKVFPVIAIFFLLLTTPYLLPTIIYAAENPPKITANQPEFATSYDVIYDIGQDGVTIVTEKITLRNLTSQFYASQFKLIIGATQIYDIKASDESGPMEVSSEQKENSTIIGVKFNQQVAGINKTLPWTLQFKSKDFAERAGKVWEVRAPKISTSTNLENYNLTLSVPLEFGEPTLISPTPKSQTTSSGKLFLTFDKEQLKNSGISANFGSNQLFDFDLTYHLENNNLVPILTNIALPPDTPFQDIIYQRIDPKPVNVTVDQDGNYLAWYKLSRGQKLDIRAIGSAKIYTSSKVKNPQLDENSRKRYTQADRYWEKDNPAVSSKLMEILGTNPPTETPEKARLIYRYVVSNLKYDSSRLSGDADRLGALTALNNPTKAVCIEFTDLFIALARAAGIPARALEGFAYTTNPVLRPVSLSQDILHAWPEYFDEKRGWVMVDPTWENTTGGVDYFNKLDLNHFTFAIKGSSSSQPIPAGSYKGKGSGSRDVKVSLSENDFLGKPQIQTQIDTPSPILAGFPSKIKIKILNEGNALYNLPSFSVNSNQLTILGGIGKSLGPIPAFGEASFEFNIRTKSIFDEYSDQITVLAGGQKFTQDVLVKPFILFQTVPIMIGGIVLIMLSIYALVLGGIIYRKRFLNKGQKKPKK